MTAVRPRRRMSVDLRVDEVMLNARRQLVPFGQCQTQMTTS
jgi:hypothetical protein